MKNNDHLTIKEARDIMRPQLNKGTMCLCCGRPTKIYSRSITSSMAAGLIVLYRGEKQKNYPNNFEQDGYIHLENLFKYQVDLPSSVRGDIPKLRFWGLIEPRTDERVMSSINLYSNKMYGFSVNSTLITIKDALNNKFNYDKLMEL